MVDELKGRVFTQEEVNTILSRAVERQNPAAGGLTYAELIDTARQAGIDPAAIDEAALNLREHRAVAIEADQVEAEIQRRKWRSWRRFSLHFTVYVMFSALIAFINLHEGGEIVFPIFILAWGTVIAAHLTSVLFGTVLPNPDRVESVRTELRERQERREAKNRRREVKEQRIVRNDELKASAKELGVAVQRGMATVLSDVAKTIHEEVDRATRESRSGTAGVRVETRTRVDDRGSRDDDPDEGSASEGKRAKRRL
jgi:hypothetical protein